MAASPAGLRFPYSRVLLPRTRLAYIHLRNLLTDAKRDRAARISGYVAISLPEELVTLYLVGGEVANATIRDAKGARAVSIAAALETVPQEPEYGEICFHEADPEQLDCMFSTQSTPAEPWPTGMPRAIGAFGFILVFDGVLEIVAGDAVNTSCSRQQRGVLLSRTPHGDRGPGLETFEGGRVADCASVRRASHLPCGRRPQSCRMRGVNLVKRLVAEGRDGAGDRNTRARISPPSICARLFSFSGKTTADPLTDRRSRRVAA